MRLKFLKLSLSDRLEQNDVHPVCSGINNKNDLLSISTVGLYDLFPRITISMHLRNRT